MLTTADAFILQHILRLHDVHVDCSYIVWFTYGIFGVIIMSTQLR
jgi:hypothetical protein